MPTTIDQMRLRVRWAEIVKGDLESLLTSAIGDYTVVDDGQDLWLALTTDVEEAIEDIVGEILDGEHYRWFALDCEGGAKCVAYDSLCQRVNTIYSRIGMPSDIESIAELDPDVRKEIADRLCVLEELEDYLA